LKSAPMPVARPAAPPRPEVRVAALETDVPTDLPAPPPAAAPAPKLTQAPHAATPPPSNADRGRLNQLVTLASLDPTEALTRRPVEADRHRLDAMVSMASLDASAPSAPAAAPGARVAPVTADVPAPVQPQAATENWAPSPEFDDDHPEELSYRPFPIAPLLTESASADDAALVKIVHPDLQRTLDLLDDKEIVLPMRLRPGSQVTGVTWAQQFQGSAVDFSAQHSDGPAQVAAAARIPSRPVRTTAR